MSYETHMSPTPVANRIIPVLVVCLHIAVLGVVLWGRFFRIETPQQPPGVDVELVYLDQPETQDPVVDQPKPVVEQPQPVVEQPQPKPVVERPKPVVERPKPVVERPKPEPVVERPKPPPKKTWTLASVEDIRQRDDFQPAQPTAPTPAVDVRKLASEFRKAGSSVRLSPRPSRPVGSPTSTVRQDAFDAQAMQVVAAQWPPSFPASELDGPGREVTVRFVIGSDGRVLEAKITRRSKVSAIDREAGRLLRTIVRFPAPADYGITSTRYEVTCVLGAKD